MFPSCIQALHLFTPHKKSSVICRPTHHLFGFALNRGSGPVQVHCCSTCNKLASWKAQLIGSVNTKLLVITRHAHNKQIIDSAHVITESPSDKWGRFNRLGDDACPHRRPHPQQIHYFSQSELSHDRAREHTFESIFIAGLLWEEQTRVTVGGHNSALK